MRHLLGAISFGLLAGAGLIDHPFEKATNRNPEARRLGLDPGATLVVKPDTNNGGLGRCHDPVNSNPECLHQRAQNGGSQVVGVGGFRLAPSAPVAERRRRSLLPAPEGARRQAHPKEGDQPGQTSEGRPSPDFSILGRKLRGGRRAW
jgi:hypothetical protein